MGKTFLITSFVDANLMAYLTTGRSQTVITHILNKTHREWYSKSQFCVKTDTYGSEYAADHICTDHIVDLCNTLQYIGVPLQMVNGSDASFMFGDKFSVVKSTVILAVKLQLPSRIIKYYRTREAQVEGVIKSVHMHGNENPSDIVTKSRAYNTWSPLMNPLLFWRDMDFLKEQVVAKGSENRSSTPPLYETMGTP